MAAGSPGAPWSRRRFIVTAGATLTGAALLGAGAGEVLVSTSAHPPPDATGVAVASGTGRPSPTPRPSETPSPSPSPYAFRTSGFRAVALPLAARAYGGQTLLPERPTYPVDTDGVPVVLRDGVAVTHPENLASIGLHLLDSHAQTGAGAYLDQARAIAGRMAAIGIPSRGGSYLPYSFNSRLHGRSDDVMRAPWPSAMAQGMALSLMVRLHAATGDASHLVAARQLFTTLADAGVRRTPWVSGLDAHGYLWLEEYPARVPDQTLNGFDFAIFGLYDWDQAVHEPDSAAVLDGALTTIAQYLPSFRHPHAVSYYCLAHHVLSAKYHAIVIRQLRLLTAMTGNGAFTRAADTFQADHA